jgi:hypothetical protein
MDRRYPEGIYFELARDGSPTYVIGSVAIKHQVFLEWLNSENPKPGGYVRLDVLMSREGKPYFSVNDFVPKNKKSESSEDLEKIPF